MANPSRQEIDLADQISAKLVFKGSGNHLDLIGFHFKGREAEGARSVIASLSEPLAIKDEPYEYQPLGRLDHFFVLLALEREIKGSPLFTFEQKKELSRECAHGIANFLRNSDFLDRPHGGVGAIRALALVTCKLDHPEYGLIWRQELNGTGISPLLPRIENSLNLWFDETRKHFDPVEHEIRFAALTQREGPRGEKLRAEHLELAISEDHYMALYPKVVEALAHELHAGNRYLARAFNGYTKALAEQGDFIEFAHAQKCYFGTTEQRKVEMALVIGMINDPVRRANVSAFIGLLDDDTSKAAEFAAEHTRCVGILKQDYLDSMHQVMRGIRRKEFDDFNKQVLELT